MWKVEHLNIARKQSKCYQNVNEGENENLTHHLFKNNFLILIYVSHNPSRAISVLLEIYIYAFSRVSVRHTVGNI